MDCDLTASNRLGKDECIVKLTNTLAANVFVCVQPCGSKPKEWVIEQYDTVVKYVGASLVVQVRFTRCTIR